jgi:hypothetical protein
MRFDSELCASERAFLEERDKVVLRGIRAFLHPRASVVCPTPQSPGQILQTVTVSSSAVLKCFF